MSTVAQSIVGITTESEALQTRYDRTVEALGGINARRPGDLKRAVDAALDFGGPIPINP